MLSRTTLPFPLLFRSSQIARVRGLCITTKCWVMLPPTHSYVVAVAIQFFFLRWVAKKKSCHQCQRHLLHAEQHSSRTRFWWLVSSFQLTFARFPDRYQREWQQRLTDREREWAKEKERAKDWVALLCSVASVKQNEMCTCDMLKPIEEQRTPSSPAAFAVAVAVVLVVLLPAYLIIVHSVNVAWAFANQTRPPKQQSTLNLYNFRWINLFNFGCHA